MCRRRLCTTAGSTMSAPGCRKSTTPGGAGTVAPDTSGCMVWVHSPQGLIVLKPGLLEHSQPPCSGGTGEQLAPVPLLGQRTHSVTASYHVTLCPSGRDASKCTGNLIIPQPQTFHGSPVPTGVHSASLHAFKMLIPGHPLNVSFSECFNSWILGAGTRICMFTSVTSRF